MVARIGNQLCSTRYPSLFERLLANTTQDSDNPNACWLWAGKSTKGDSGNRYPKLNMRIEGAHKSVYAHRTMLEIVEDKPMAANEESDHLCYQTLCINPDHLERVTKQANYQRRRGRT